MQLARAAVVVTLGVAACVVACSSGAAFSSSSAPGFGSASTGGDVPGSGSAFPSQGCPLTSPHAGTPCIELACEYGSAADPACNTIARCGIAGNWVIEQPTQCPSTCPSRFDERVPGAPCSDPDVCTYLEATCGCAGAIAAAAADGGADAGADAADPDAAAPVGHWQCVRPGNGCPARRPVVGTPCAKTMTCDYGTCVFGVPLTYDCATSGLGRVWMESSGPACP